MNAKMFLAVVGCGMLGRELDHLRMAAHRPMQAIVLAPPPERVSVLNPTGLLSVAELLPPVMECDSTPSVITLKADRVVTNDFYSEGPSWPHPYPPPKRGRR